LLFYSPVALLASASCAALEFSLRVTWSLALPTAGLLACLWVLTLVDHLALFLDTRLVSGPASTRNAWHHTMRRYFVGYVRRSGIEIGARLLDRTLFLP